MRAEGFFRSGHALAIVAPAAIAMALARAAAAADVASTWTGAAGASWNIASNWSNVAAVAQFPNNGNGGFTYDVTVFGGSPALASNITIEKLTLTTGSIAGGTSS